MELKIQSLEELQSWVKNFSSSLKPKDIICLKGDLGVGKTTLASDIIKCLLGVEVNVTSPTFNLVHTYQWKDGISIWHFDLYRLNSLEEVYNLAFEDALQFGLCIIEWPELVWDLLPDDAIIIELEFGKVQESRILNIKYKSTND